MVDPQLWKVKLTNICWLSMKCIDFRSTEENKDLPHILNQKVNFWFKEEMYRCVLNASEVTQPLIARPNLDGAPGFSLQIEDPLLDLDFGNPQKDS